MTSGKCCADHCVAKAGQQSATEPLHHSADDQQFHRRAGGIGRCAEREDGEGRDIGKRRSLPVEDTADE